MSSDLHFDDFQPPRGDEREGESAIPRPEDVSQEVGDLCVDVFHLDGGAVGALLAKGVEVEHPE